MSFEQRRFGLGCPSLYQVKWLKAGATQTETSLLKQYVAGERVELPDDYDFPARTITEALNFFESPWKNMENDTTFVRMRIGDHLGDAKMSKRAPLSVIFNFFYQLR